jgi:hypothetical protein
MSPFFKISGFFVFPGAIIYTHAFKLFSVRATIAIAVESLKCLRIVQLGAFWIFRTCHEETKRLYKQLS